MSGLNVQKLMDNMSSDLRSLLSSRNISSPLMIGIHTGGVWVANILHEQLNLQEPLGTLNITFYRDDFTHIGIHPQVQPSSLPFSIDDRHIILVDDVLHTGRTIRAALNEIFDYGRPASVILAVMVDRGCHELPIAADVKGETVTLDKNQHLKLVGPEKLELLIQESA